MTIRAKNRFKCKEHQYDEVKALFTHVAAIVLAEDGYVDFTLEMDGKTGEFIWSEEWEDFESLERHLRSPHFRHLCMKLVDYIDS